MSDIRKETRYAFPAISVSKCKRLLLDWELKVELIYLRLYDFNLVIKTVQCAYIKSCNDIFVIKKREVCSHLKNISGNYHGKNPKTIL